MGLVSNSVCNLSSLKFDNWVSFSSQYHFHARRLRKTGKGIKPDLDTTDSGPPDPSMHDLELQHYVPPTGPDSETPKIARNIWGKCLPFLEKFS